MRKKEAFLCDDSSNRYKKPQSAQFKLKTRGCLMCSRSFVSEGPHNRVCRKCKSTQLWREGEFETV